jgi:uroporphyrinogen decarboxylase
MKLNDIISSPSSSVLLIIFATLLWSINGYLISSPSVEFRKHISSRLQASLGDESDPILIRAARGETVERTPVWMMRQAGRHMKVYQELCKKYKTFRERSENADIATEIRYYYCCLFCSSCLIKRLCLPSLQPWRAYGTDGCILFSDILTPLPGMGINFDITEKEGPKIRPITTLEEVNAITPIDPYKSTPFVATALQNLRREVGNKAAVLGFIGLPYTLASYIIEGGGSNDYQKIKSMGYTAPCLLTLLLEKLANNIADYACFQIENGAQVIQFFDSWAGNLCPADYDLFAAPYQQKVIQTIKEKHPTVPLILYINKSGAILERMKATGADFLSLDWTVTLAEARKRLGEKIGFQGNLDPMLLFAPDEVIKERTIEILKEGRGAGGATGGGSRHIMNLGHGIDARTSEEKAKLFVDTVKNFRF